ncbi:ferredoxin-type protein NapF [Photobacterium ganghwense]|uniref:ferredoxin-type protein NapF n=1 Tax=Photobacterium ganghwense TaxID=320778 RepID=UPI001C2DA07A|nr:ferredoxin-type protein NapF [Photobacterium ganghwense]MBV1840435.1 ferredoxin-type protein NapF [Photobacterium ganghwense]
MFDRSRRRLLTRRSKPEQQRLPWMVNDDIFTDGCTRCGKCAAACETQIIIHGDGGFPEVDFKRGECTFCYRCADVCPEPLFHSQTTPAWAMVAEIGEGCLAYQHVECRSCGDMCETQAIRFRLQPGGVAQPELEATNCTGCGSCVSVCPTSAITVVNPTNKES